MVKSREKALFPGLHSFLVGNWTVDVDHGLDSVLAPTNSLTTCLNVW